MADIITKIHDEHPDIEKYIDYYTNKRVQRNLGVLTPMEFHERKLENVA
ncbi:MULTISPECIES: IS3 family transposase [Blautia]|nr:IS3 family transposase [Blautia obeum]